MIVPAGAWVLSTAAAFLSIGCATRVTDSKGHIHTVGLFWQTTIPANNAVSSAGSATIRFTPGRIQESDARLVRLRTLGALVSWTDVERGLSLGWNDSLVVYPDSEGLTLANFTSTDPFASTMKAEPDPPRFDTD